MVMCVDLLRRFGDVNSTDEVSVQHAFHLLSLTLALPDHHSRHTRGSRFPLGERRPTVAHAGDLVAAFPYIRCSVPGDARCAASPDHFTDATSLNIDVCAASPPCCYIFTMRQSASAEGRRVGTVYTPYHQLTPYGISRSSDGEEAGARV